MNSFLSGLGRLVVAEGPMEVKRAMVLFVATGLIAAFPASLFAQNELRTFSLSRLRGEIVLGVEREVNRDRGLGFVEERETGRTEFIEKLKLKGDGSILHPRFMEYKFDLGLGMRQDKFVSEREESGQQMLQDINLEANLMKKKVYPTSLYFRRDTSRVTRDFFEPVEVFNQIIGARVSHLNRHFPSLFIYERRAREEETFDFRRESLEDTVSMDVTNEYKKNLKTTFRYNFSDFRDVLERTETLLHSANLLNTWDFGKEQNKRLSTGLSLQQQSGVGSSSSFGVSESLQMEHLKNLSSGYLYQFRKSESPTLSYTQHQGQAQIRHQLYGSLTSQAQLSGLLQQGDNFNEDSFGGGFSLSYRKKIPKGALSLSYGLSLNRVDRTGLAGALSVINEVHTLVDGVLSFLVNPMVLLDSVVVTDSFRRVILIREIDYRLIVRDGLVEIQRVGLPDGSTVSVDYQFQGPGDMQYMTRGQGYGARLDMFSMVSLFYNHTESINKLLDGVATGFLIDRIKDLVGAEVRWKWFNLAAEQEDDRSSISPFKATRLRGQFRWQPTPTSALSLMASHSRVDFKLVNQRNVITFLDGHYTMEILRGTRVNLEAGVMRQAGVGREEKAFRARGVVESKIRDLTISAGAEAFMRDETGRQRDRTFFFIKVSRPFGIF